MKLESSRVIPVKFSLLSIILLSLIGCGFHLRGQMALPPAVKNISVISDVDDPFIQQIKQRLEQYSINVTDDEKLSASVLTINNLTHRSSVSSVSSSTNTRQYYLSYQLFFSLTVNKKILLNNQSVTSSRTLTVDANRILGSDDEEITLKQEMQQDLLRKLMQRLSAQFKTL